jgi:methylglyoxal reductase
MKYLKVENMKMSALALGTWGMGGGTSWADSDDKVSIDIIHKAKDLGINVVDTAPVYGTGHSEEVVGKALAGRRGDYILSTKCAMQWRNTQGVKMYERDGKSVYKSFTPESLEADLEGSLRRLNTDYIDIYITHRQPDDMALIPEVYNTLSKFKKEGKIRAIGISNASAAHLEAYLTCGPVALAQEKFSMLESKALEDYIPLCVKNKTLFQAYSTLERGLLGGKIRMDYKLQKGEARASIKWFQDDKRPEVLAMLDSWKDLCQKYSCSTANLVMAYTMTISPGMEILFGVRHMENLLDTAKCLDLSLDQDDIARMKADIKGVR